MREVAKATMIEIEIWTCIDLGQVVLCRNGDSLKKGMESAVEKSLLVCTFQYSERPKMSMEEISDSTDNSNIHRLKPVWNDRSISLSSKIQLMCSLSTSIFLYACESWTLTAELQRRIRAMEMWCYHKILRISYKDHVTNEEVRAKIQQATGPHEDLLTIVNRCKLQ